MAIDTPGADQFLSDRRGADFSGGGGCIGVLPKRLLGFGSFKNTLYRYISVLRGLYERFGGFSGLYKRNVIAKEQMFEVYANYDFFLGGGGAGQCLGGGVHPPA